MEFRKKSNMHHHKVAFLQRQLLEKQKVVLTSGQHRHSNLTRDMSYKKDLPPLSMAAFTEILDIDAHTALVEPGVTFASLVKETLKKGLLPPVVPEFKGITVGGAFAGASLESSSYIYGQFSDTVLGLTVLLGSGEIIGVSRTENSDLFWGLSGSYGTLGIILSLTIQLIPAAKNVHVGKEGQFRESLILEDRRVDLPAAFTNEPANFSVTPFSDWFYKRVQKRSDFIMPLYDYLFRYDRGAFWMASTFQGPSWLLRYLFSIKSEASFNKPWEVPALFRPLFTSQRLYRILHKLPDHWFEKNFVVQDFYIPEKNVPTFIEQVTIKPLWLCPLKGTEQPQIFSPHYKTGEKLVDVGVYGVDQSAPETTKALEKLCRSLGGRKMLYSYNYYEPEEFWDIYDETAYQNLRKKYYGEKAFLPIEEKLLKKQN